MALGDFFKRVLVYTLQRPLADDLNHLQTRLVETLRLTWMTMFGESYASTPALSLLNSTVWQQPRGFYSISFFAAPDPTATPYGIFLYPGFGFAPTGPATTTDLAGAPGANWETGASPLLLSTAQTGLSVPSVPAAGHSRIDIIEVRANLVADEPATLGIYNPTSRVYDPTVKNTSADWDLYGRTGTVTSPASSTAAISYKVGVDYAGGISGATPPAVTSGYVQVARINLDGAVAAITQDLIVDMRQIVRPHSTLEVSGDVTIPGVAAGLGLSSMASLQVPPGTTVKVAFANGTPPSAGTSYTAAFYVFGGSLYGRSTSTGAAIATPHSNSARCVSVVADGVFAIDQGIVDILDGTDTTWTVVNGTVSVPLGTVCARFFVTIRHPAGSALDNAERFNFVYRNTQA